MACTTRTRSSSGTSSRRQHVDTTTRSSASKSKASRQHAQRSRWVRMVVRRSGVSSPSRNPYSWRRASPQSVGWWRSGTGGALLVVVVASSGRGTHGLLPRGLDQAASCGELVQPLLEPPSSAMEAAHDGSDGDVEDLGDLLVGEALDVGQQDGQSELLGQGLDGLPDLALGQDVEELVLGAPAGPGPLEAAEAAVEVEVLDLVQVGLVRSALGGRY